MKQAKIIMAVALSLSLTACNLPSGSNTKTITEPPLSHMLSVSKNSKQKLASTSSVISLTT